MPLIQIPELRGINPDAFPKATPRFAPSLGGAAAQGLVQGMLAVDDLLEKRRQTAFETLQAATKLEHTITSDNARIEIDRQQANNQKAYYEGQLELARSNAALQGQEFALTKQLKLQDMEQQQRIMGEQQRMLTAAAKDREVHSGEINNAADSVQYGATWNSSMKAGDFGTSVFGSGNAGSDDIDSGIGHSGKPSNAVPGVALPKAVILEMFPHLRGRTNEETKANIDREAHVMVTGGDGVVHRLPVVDIGPAKFVHERAGKPVIDLNQKALAQLGGAAAQRNGELIVEREPVIQSVEIRAGDARANTVRGAPTTNSFSAAIDTFDRVRSRTQDPMVLAQLNQREAELRQRNPDAFNAHLANKQLTALQALSALPEVDLDESIINNLEAGKPVDQATFEMLGAQLAKAKQMRNAGQAPGVTGNQAVKLAEKAEGRFSAIEGLTDLQTMFKELQKDPKQRTTGIVASRVNAFMSRVGFNQGDNWTKIQTKLTDQKDLIIRDRTGAAVTEAEIALYDTIVGSLAAEPAVAIQRLDTLINTITKRHDNASTTALDYGVKIPPQFLTPKMVEYGRARGMYQDLPAPTAAAGPTSGPLGASTIWKKLESQMVADPTREKGTYTGTDGTTYRLEKNGSRFTRKPGADQQWKLAGQ